MTSCTLAALGRAQDEFNAQRAQRARPTCTLPSCAQRAEPGLHVERWGHAAPLLCLLCMLTLLRVAAGWAHDASDASGDIHHLQRDLRGYFRAHHGRGLLPGTEATKWTCTMWGRGRRAQAQVARMHSAGELRALAFRGAPAPCCSGLGGCMLTGAAPCTRGRRAGGQVTPEPYQRSMRPSMQVPTPLFPCPGNFQLALGM